MFSFIWHILIENEFLNCLKVIFYARLGLVISLTLICICLPVYHSLSLTRKFFKFNHNFNHHFVYQKINWLHNSKLYHNESIHISVFWSCLVLCLTFYDTNLDLKHIAKRSGRIAVALLPTILILTLRPTPLPNLLYLSLLPYHKWISRILILESFLHCGLYFYWFSISNSMYKLLKFRNVCGILALLCFLLIGITSINKVRRMNFKLFYYIHYLSTWASILMLHIHSKPSIVYYSIFCVMILLYQILYRVLHTKKVKVSIICISPTVSLLEFPKEGLSNLPILPATHVRLNIMRKNFFSNIFNNFIVPFQHPFTIASLPNDEVVQLIIRNGGTLKLNTNKSYYVTGCFEPMIDFISKPRQVSFFTSIFNSIRSYRISNFNNGTINGTNNCSDNSNPIISSNYMTDDLLNILGQPSANLPFQVSSLPLLSSPLSYKINATRVFMVVGGTAISFALPVLRILNFNGVHTRLIWVIRDYQDLQLINHFKNNFEGLEVFVSGTNSIDYVEEYNRLQENNDRMSLGNSSFENENDQTNLLPLDSNNPTYGSINNQDDEIDFTEEFSRKKLPINKDKNNVSKKKRRERKNKKGNFREQTVIEPPNDTDYELSENLNSSHSNYNSDIESSTAFNGVNPKMVKKIRIPAGIKVSFGRPVLNNSHYNWCLEKECMGPTDTNLCCHPNRENSSHVDDLANVWVVAAGPHSLIENTKRWATDGGLHFYEEGFAV